MTRTVEKALIDAPLYTPLDVSRYLRAPIWLVMGAWRGGFPPHPELFFRWFERGLRHFDMDDALPDVPEFRDRWSFRQLADLYVRFFAIESLLEFARAEMPEDRKAESLHEAAWGILRDRPVPVFLGNASPEKGIAHVLGHCRGRLSDTAMLWLEKRLRLCLGRIDMVGGSPCRLHPFSRVPAEGSLRVVVIDPEIRFGRPTVVGRGTPTDMLLERHQAGDSIADLAEDYGIPEVEVEEAIRYEARPLSPLLPFFIW